MTRAEGAPPEDWIRIAPDKAWVDRPRWAPDGRQLYFLAKAGSFLNLWGVQFDPERGGPVGVPFKLTTFESPALTISRRLAFAGFDISGQRPVITMRIAAGYIWMIDNVDH